MGYLIGFGIILGIIAGICYGIYTLCALIWNMQVCYHGSMDAMFSVTLIIVVLLAALVVVCLIVAALFELDGLKTFVLRIMLPAAIGFSALSGIVYIYGYCEPVFLGVDTLSDPAYNNYFLNTERDIMVNDLSPFTTIRASVIFISGTLIFIVAAFSVIMALISCVEYGDIYPGNGFRMLFKCLYRIFLPVLILVAVLVGWYYLTTIVLWDYDLFDLIIHGIATSGALLGAVVGFAFLVNRQPLAAAFSLGLAAAVAFVSYTVFGAKILLDLMSEYYLFIILGFIGLYLLLGVIYCLTRIKVIRNIIRRAKYMYWL